MTGKKEDEEEAVLVEAELGLSLAADAEAAATSIVISWNKVETMYPVDSVFVVLQI